MNYLAEVKGRGNTVARVVAYSKSSNGDTTLITFEYEAYRAILAELNTHGMLCKNAESSRAVPVVGEKGRTTRIFKGDFYKPISWGKNQGGMVAGEESQELIEWDGDLWHPDEFWEQWAVENARRAEAASFYHKQVIGRPLEAFTTIKGVITATEFDNFFHLRTDEDADPAIRELANCMWEAKCEVEEKGLIETLRPGEWHTPYVQHERCKTTGVLLYGLIRAEEDFYKACKDIPLSAAPNWFIITQKDGKKSYWERLSLKEALKTSAVACGQVSFRKLDTSEETVERVWKRSFGGKTVHASIAQHQATPILYTNIYNSWPEGVTHMDREGNLWSAQLKGWIMHRKLIPNEVCKKFIPKESDK